MASPPTRRGALAAALALAVIAAPAWARDIGVIDEHATGSVGETVEAVRAELAPFRR